MNLFEIPVPLELAPLEMAPLEMDWGWGLMMTGVGMSVVFGLLALLWALLHLIARGDEWAARRAARAEAAAVAQAPAPKPVAAAPASPTVTIADPDGLDDDTIAAIAIAVIKHADVRRKQAAPEMRANAPGSQLWASRWVAVGRGLQNTPWRRR
ncbi:OadG family transporter subunit [Aestuariimicrobium ganziense]|uniref:OadG family transporter subunit n=1 Tax=Aestuariimicrobium ganziense TaxID=2773677 RepID=UPI00194404B5|nr:OadG family transporter subunit [Aestuariimicrobium ganziense]